MRIKIMYHQQVIVLLTTIVAVLSATEDILIETPEGPQLLNGFEVYVQFHLYNEKFINGKLHAATSFFSHHSKVPFAQLFSNMRTTDYISIVILHSLYTEDRNSLPCLAELATFVYKEGAYEEENDWLRQNINFPSEKSFLVVKSLVSLGNKGIVNIPSPILQKIISILDIWGALETAVEVGNKEVITWILGLKFHFEHLEKLLISAFSNNRIDIVKLLIEKGALDNVSASQGHLISLISPKKETLLHLAAQLHRPVAMAALLELGLKPDDEDNDGYTALHRAVEADDEKTVALLVKKGADVNLPNPLGDLPLHTAVTKGNLKMTKLLIKLRSSLDTKNNLGFTPLYVAENMVVAAVVRYIEDTRWEKRMNASKKYEEYSCKNDECSAENPTALNSILVEKINDFFTNLNLREIFCHHNDLQFVITLSEIVNIFLRKGEVSRMPSYLQMLLSLKANKIGNEELSEIMINLGYDTPDMNIQPILDSIEDINAAFMSIDENVKFKNETGHTNLHISASEGNLKVVKALVSKGADVQALTNNNWTPLHFAASQGHEEIVEFLIKNNASINAKTSNEETPLHLASANGHARVVEILLKYDADINAEMSPNCMSSLYIASSAGHLEVVEMLVNDEALLNGRDCGSYNLAPLQIAALNGRISIVRFLALNGADIDVRDNEGNTALYTAAWNGMDEMVKALVELHADVKLRIGKAGFTALHAAALRGHARVVELLLQGGADPNIKDKSHATPLHWAATLEVANVLLRNGASVDARNVNIETPLHKASSLGQADIVKRLLESGANIDAKTIDGKTPAYEAILHNQFASLKILLESGANLYAVGPNGYTVLNFGISKGFIKLNNS